MPDAALSLYNAVVYGSESTPKLARKAYAPCANCNMCPVKPVAKDNGFDFLLLFNILLIVLITVQLR